MSLPIPLEMMPCTVNTLLGIPTPKVMAMNQSSRPSSDPAMYFEKNLKSTIAPLIVPKLTDRA